MKALLEYSIGILILAVVLYLIAPLLFPDDAELRGWFVTIPVLLIPVLVSLVRGDQFSVAVFPAALVCFVIFAQASDGIALSAASIFMLAVAAIHGCVLYLDGAFTMATKPAEPPAPQTHRSVSPSEPFRIFLTKFITKLRES